MLINTLSQAFVPARVVNETSAAYRAKLPTFTLPLGDAQTATGASVFQVADSQGNGPNSLIVAPYGTGADANTFSFEVIGWRAVAPPPNPAAAPASTTLWVPVALVDATATLSSTNVGIANSLVPAANFFAKTITINQGAVAGLTYVVSFAAAGVLAHIVVNLRGFQAVELIFKTGTNTDSNALIALF